MKLDLADQQRGSPSREATLVVSALDVPFRSSMKRGITLVYKHLAIAPSRVLQPLSQREGLIVMWTIMVA